MKVSRGPDEKTMKPLSYSMQQFVACLVMACLRFSCSFGKARASANLSSPGQLSCDAPAGFGNAAMDSSGFVPVSVVRRTGHEATVPDSSASSMPFLYTRKVVLTKIQPESGSASGGTRVDISAINAELSYIRAVNVDPDLRCRFGGVDATVGYASGRSIPKEGVNNVYCIAPPFTGTVPAQVAVEVSVNGGADFIPFESVFIYLENPTVTGVQPTSVSANGGSVVIVSGTGLPGEGEVVCVFGGIDDGGAAHGSWVSTTGVECVAPAHPPGFTLVSVMLNGADVVTSVAVLEYVEELSVSSISPDYSAVGAGEVITIHGKGFINSSLLSMRWQLSPQQEGASISDTQAWHMIDLTFVNSSAATFEAPRIATGDGQDDSVLNFAVSNNALDFIAGPVDVRLAIAGPPTASECFPRYGSLLGGTRVSLTGGGFIRGSTWCRFGLKKFNATTGDLLERSLPLVAADVRNYSHLTCITPETSAPSGTYFIEVITGARNNIELGTEDAEGSVRPPGVTATVGFAFIRPPTVSNVEPQILLESGGTLVSIEGKNLTHTGLEACRFGGEDVASATWWSDDFVRCESPPGIVGPVILELTLNGMEWIPAPVTLHYEPDRFVYSLYPSSGPLRGGTLVGVTGTGFTAPGVERDPTRPVCSFGPIEVGLCLSTFHPLRTDTTHLRPVSR